MDRGGVGQDTVQIEEHGIEVLGSEWGVGRVHGFGGYPVSAAETPRPRTLG